MYEVLTRACVRLGFSERWYREEGPKGKCHDGNEATAAAEEEAGEETEDREEEWAEGEEAGG